MNPYGPGLWQQPEFAPPPPGMRVWPGGAAFGVARMPMEVDTNAELGRPWC